MGYISALTYYWLQYVTGCCKELGCASTGVTASEPPAVAAAAALVADDNDADVTGGLALKSAAAGDAGL